MGSVKIVALSNKATVKKSMISQKWRKYCASTRRYSSVIVYFFTDFISRFDGQRWHGFTTADHTEDPADDRH